MVQAQRNQCAPGFWVETVEFAFQAAHLVLLLGDDPTYNYLSTPIRCIRRPWCGARTVGDPPELMPELHLLHEERSDLCILRWLFTVVECDGANGILARAVPLGT